VLAQVQGTCEQKYRCIYAVILHAELAVYDKLGSFLPIITTRGQAPITQNYSRLNTSLKELQTAANCALVLHLSRGRDNLPDGWEK
jgi:hypothetical protein